MKRYYFLGLVLCVFLMTRCTSDQRPRVIDRPVYGLQSSKTLEIDKIELTDSATILYIDAYFSSGSWIRIDSGTYLQANGEKYKIQGSEGIILNERHGISESGEDHFALIFPSLPKGTKSFDFIESDCEDCFKIWDVDLTGKPKKYTPALPSDILNYKPDPEKELPAPKFEIARTKLKIHLRGLEEGYIPKISLYKSTIASANGDIISPMKVSNNEYLFEFNQYTTSNVRLLINNFSLQVLLEPGEVADIFFDIAAYSRFSSRYHPDPEMIFAGFRGKFAQINNELLRGNYEELKKSSFFENASDILNISPDAYTSNLLEKYEEKSLALTNSSMPDDLKHFAQLRLKVELLDYVFLKDYRYKDAYEKENNFSYDEDSLDATEADFKRLSVLNLNDPYLLCVNTFFPIVHFIKAKYPLETIDMITGSSSGLLQDIYKSSEALELVPNMEPLTETAENSLKSVSDPFFIELQKFLSQKAKKEYEAILKKGGFEIAETPDVKTDKIIETIVSQHVGQVVFVDFWATWCAPCLNAMKAIRSIKPKLQEQGVVFIYISGTSSPKNKWIAMLPQIGGIHYYLTEEQWRVICKKYAIQGIPSYLIFDKKGNKTFESTGYPGNDKIVEEIEKIK